MRRGILAAFEEVNRAGGVNGRRLELRSYDDRYEPEQAVANTLKLINDDHVFALIGAVGTPTSAAAEPIAQADGVPFIAPFTGADFLRDPALTNVVNIRASYSEETEAIVERIVGDTGTVTRRRAVPGRFLWPERPCRREAGAWSGAVSNWPARKPICATRQPSKPRCWGSGGTIRKPS